MFRRSRVAVACVCLSACGGAAPQAEPPRVAVAPAATPAPVPSPPATNPPPAALLSYWVSPKETPVFTARVALGSLARGPLFRAILPTVTPSVPARYQPCLGAVVDHAEELWLRGAENRGFAVVSFDAKGAERVRSACVGSVVSTSQPATIPGATEAYLGGDDVLAIVAPNVALLGNRAEVEAALAPGRTPAPPPAHFTLKGDELGSVRVDVAAPPVGVSATLASSPEQFMLDARAELPGPELAERVEQGFGFFRAQAKERVKEAGGDASVQALLDSVTLERTGQKLHATLALGGSIEQQAHAIGQLTAISVVATERYLLNAKAAEAKAVMAQIVKVYQQALREPGGLRGKAPRKLVSLPAVPPTVPRGEPYQSTADDWKAWAPIHFTLPAPQRFQYEVVAAKDGKSAQIVARGDLNGDGQPSERRLTIELDPKSLQLTAKGLEETKPLE